MCSSRKFQDILLKTAVIDALIYTMNSSSIEGSTHYPCTVAVDIIYQGTVPGSPARQLMLDTHLAKGHRGWTSSKPEQTNKEFLMDLTCGLFEKKRTSDVVKPDVSSIVKGTYHEVADGKHKRRRDQQ